MPVRGERARLAAIGMLQGAGLTILLTLSLQWIESTHTILLMYTNPLWALLLSVLLLGERFSIASVAGIALGLGTVDIHGNRDSRRRRKLIQG